MPYQWYEPHQEAPKKFGASLPFTEADLDQGSPLLFRLNLWPYQAMTKPGFATFIAITAALFLLPLLALLGKVQLWVLLPFLLSALALIWFALRRHQASRVTVEELRIWDNAIRLDHYHPKSDSHETWQSNPYWVTVTLYKASGKVPNYLTLRGDNREVELGAFLSEDERLALFDDLPHALPHAQFTHRT